MANMTFKASLLPNTDLGYSLGSEDKRWKINNAFVLPVYYSNIDYSNTAPITGAYTLNAQTHPVTGTIEYGSALSLPGTADGAAPYAAQLVISSASGQSSPVHAYIRRLTDTPLWSNWSTLLDNNNYTTYTDTRYLKLSGGTLTGNLDFKTSSADSPDLVWYYGNTSTEQARIWMGSGGTSKWGPYYRCYNSEGTQLYTGNLVLGDGTGASGTWGINISGSATTLKDRTNNTLTYSNYGAAGLAASAITWLTCWNGYELRAISKAEMANAVDSSHKWVRLAGDTMTGPLRINGTDNSSTDARLYIDHRSNNDWGIIVDKNNSYDYGIIVKCKSDGSHGIDVTGRITGTKVYGAVWNDYAEYRKTCNAKPGQCVVEISNGELKISNKRCLPAARVISDTFGFAIGETEECQTPIAVSGRVLVYIDNSNIKIGDAVCSGKNGTVSKMRWYERILYPERIVGVVSEIPNYDEWLAGERDGNHKIKVNGRIWIYVK